MKPLFPNTIKLLGCLLLALLFQSCLKKSGAWRNGQIPTDKRNDFHKLNQQLFNDLKTDNKNDIRFLESKEMLSTPYTLREMEQVGNRLKAADYDIYDEYYIVNKYRSGDTVVNNSAGINSYTMIYNGIEHEMYIALFTPKSRALANQDMITVLYSKYNYGWKITSVSVNPYRINGKTAPELYAVAEAKFNQNKFVDARLTLELALQCNAPNDYWRYNHLDNVGKLYQQAVNITMDKYKFPVVIDNVAGQPRIFRMTNQKSDDGWFPVIDYVTRINIKDTTAVKKQNMEIRVAISKMFPGIDEDKKYIFYSACEKSPAGNGTVAHFDMVDKLR
ncbi:hypothetical protein AAFN85_08345 [Mucilaginibacter sp. CAU 1740]|uniref:hypothetical protein n=1 Tax=Mucilaginibacter sp. CAU 1740 TaxID=3140365 RepID=UPI00325BFA9A